MENEPTTQPEKTNEAAVEIYDNRSYVINISFNGPIENLHIEQYGKPINPPPPPGGQ